MNTPNDNQFDIIASLYEIHYPHNTLSFEDEKRIVKSKEEINEKIIEKTINGKKRDPDLSNLVKTRCLLTNTLLGYTFGELEKKTREANGIPEEPPPKIKPKVSIKEASRKYQEYIKKYCKTVVNRSDIRGLNGEVNLNKTCIINADYMRGLIRIVEERTKAKKLKEKQNSKKPPNNTSNNS